MVNEIVSLGKTMGLEVIDIQELVEEHGPELTTIKLMNLHCEQQQEVIEEISSAEEEKKVEESLTSNEIREMCKTWETVQHFVKKHHPNKAVAVRAMQCHISMKSSKGGKSKCQWIGFLLKLHEKKKIPLS